ncbi:hypothetical protein EBZ80_09200 [bacterium]|nr:hypothetical protein [bacterium]
MSTLTADPGFARGQVLGILWKAYDAESGDGSHIVGTRKVFRDEDPKTGKLLSNRTVECVAVKNTGSSALLPGQVAKFKDAAILSEVDGLAVAATTLMGVVDEYLPAAGVPVNEVFWLVVRGPSTVTKTATSVAAGAAYGPSATAGSAAAQGSNAQLGFAIETSATTSGRILVRTNAGF